MKDLLIHIGYHKTGSSSLQKGLFQNDIFKTISRRRKLPSTLLRSFIYDTEKYMLSSFDMNIETILNEYYNLVSNNDDNKIGVISNERFSGCPHSAGYDALKISYQLKKVFNNPKILIVIRKQEDFIFSSYFNYLKSGGSKRLKTYLYTKYDRRKPGFSPNHIDYTHIVKHYYTLFGKNNVLVLPYEMYKNEPKTFYNKIQKLFPHKSISIDFEKSDINVTKQYCGQYFFKSLNPLIKRSSLNSFYFPQYKFISKTLLSLQNFLGKIMQKYDDKLKLKLYVIIEEFCLQRYEGSNNELSKIINIDLKQYNYQ